MEKWLELAQQLGFDCMGPLEPQSLQAREDVRAMCAENKCRAYGRKWTCPPACGSLSQCQEQMHGYTRGLLLQTVGHMKKDIDSRCYRETERRHKEAFEAFCKELRKEYPQALCLGAGGCRICRDCAYPQACRFPDRATASMEAYGLFVTQVCRDAGIPYHHGPKTIAYSACVLF